MPESHYADGLVTVFLRTVDIQCGTGSNPAFILPQLTGRGLYPLH